MLRTIKNKDNKWKILLNVLSGEIPEDAPEFVAWLAEDEERELLYRTLKEGTANDSLFGADEMYRKLARKAGIENSESKRETSR